MGVLSCGPRWDCYIRVDSCSASCYCKKLHVYHCCRCGVTLGLWLRSSYRLNSMALFTLMQPAAAKAQGVILTLAQPACTSTINTISNMFNRLSDAGLPVGQVSHDSEPHATRALIRDSSPMGPLAYHVSAYKIPARAP